MPNTYAALGIAILTTAYLTHIKVEASCYAANTSSFTWCSGYENAGYNCSKNGINCASDKALGEYYFCALHYADAMLHAATGQCCGSVKDGNCNDPKPNSVHDFPYGPVDHKPGLIFEGCVQYENGPKCWKQGQVGGDYGWEANFPSENSPGGCPPLPSKFDPSKLHIARMSEAIGPSYHGCFIECNLTEVSVTGIDPCAVGNFYSPSSGHNAMKCYSGGETFVKPYPSGICAYNCSLVSTGGKPCSGPNTKDCEVTCSDSKL